MSKLSDFLLKRRHELRMTQVELAQWFNLTDRAIANYEKGRREPSLEIMLKYSRVYHVSIYKLVNLRIEDIKGGEINDVNKNS
ncbi:helix-turn-helix transcriptional regulator [Limosilactobacillus reuteri]|uniref:XRE family transcriptional regulator n=2 Tax=Limosilactobacillus reuteri TaxID=1598 RepID=S5N7Y4_LIMRT|nr:helix-turn-helix transcriptional regulator [Limosilactobacillus reuteri]AGR65291.1 XRE family transcriptional regulator [Limosilactobacillus reuteri TD1]MCC4358513.1 helix-turn-helix transcriptional regulator [Limosilactobacillus reuteri]MCC4363178.1 helix-turn-helix transcriptional regulator [Limosilactobacillus reuteri]MCC4365018.1 helix-turn-helix transcriptional regulator [Limosilactobacillus reuteri]MCH5379961.1 helix-turn-helix transcriptional regulator [Limosilactobacillus reuteri]